MSEYLIDVESDLFGPYHSKEQAKFAKHVFVSKYPNLEESCAVVAQDSLLRYQEIFEPRLLF